MPDSAAPGQAALARLLDLEEIRTLKARYFRLMDTKDWKALREVFTDDARMDIDGFVTDGGDAIAAFMSGVLASVRTVHHGHMPEITFADDGHAQGIWAMYDYVEFPHDGEGDPQGLKGYGHYHDEYRRQNGEWRIALTRLVRLRVDPLPGGMPQAPA
ncbi:nuclear transport factor 2 family protein [Streptomycetaceae bacterium NBC_01309]